MQNVQPDNLDPMPLRQSSHSVGTIMIRFVGLLTLAVRGDGADLEPLNLFSADSISSWLAKATYWRTNAVSSSV